MFMMCDKINETKEEVTYDYVLNCYCGQKMLDIVEKLQSFYNDVQKEVEKNQIKCCVCYDTKYKHDFTYLMCNHYMCTECYHRITTTYHTNICPLCRLIMYPIKLSNKYAVVCAGETTEYYTFDNGGLVSIYIFYFPEFQGVKYDVFTGITYHDDNTIRYEYITKIIDLRCQMYCVIFKDFKKITLWSNEIMIKDITPDIQFDLEKIDIKTI